MASCTVELKSSGANLFKNFCEKGYCIIVPKYIFLSFLFCSLDSWEGKEEESRNKRKERRNEKNDKFVLRGNVCEKVKTFSPMSYYHVKDELYIKTFC
jgi:hypothetical protein